MSLFYVNQITLLGNVIKSETKTTKSGNLLVRISLATQHSVKKEDNWENVPTYHDVVCFGTTAKLIQDAKKGDKIYVQGRLDKRSWEYEGKKYYATEVVADKAILVNQDTRQTRTQNQPAPQDDDIDLDKIPL